MKYLKLVQLSLFKVISGITKLYFICFSFVSIQRHKHISICSSTSYVTGPRPNIPNSFYQKIRLLSQGGLENNLNSSLFTISSQTLLALGKSYVCSFNDLHVVAR